MVQHKAAALRDLQFGSGAKGIKRDSPRHLSEVMLAQAAAVPIFLWLRQSLEKARRVACKSWTLFYGIGYILRLSPFYFF